MVEQHRERSHPDGRAAQRAVSPSTESSLTLMVEQESGLTLMVEQHRERSHPDGRADRERSHPDGRAAQRAVSP